VGKTPVLEQIQNRMAPYAVGQSENLQVPCWDRVDPSRPNATGTCWKALMPVAAQTGSPIYLTPTWEVGPLH
jgi:hypothetical protein